MAQKKKIPKFDIPYKNPDIPTTRDEWEELHHGALDAIYLTDQRSAEFYYELAQTSMSQHNPEAVIAIIRETLIYASAVYN